MARGTASRGGSAAFLVCALSLGAALRCEVEIPRYPEPVFVPGPPLPPRAVVAFGSGASDSEVAVVSADGRVEFLDATTGGVLRVVETGAAVWSLHVRNPGRYAQPKTLHYRIPEVVALSGIPIAARRGGVFAVTGERLREFPAAGGAREWIAVPWLRGARLVAPSGTGNVIHLLLADGRLARIDGDEARFSERPVPGTATILIADEPNGRLLVAGSGSSWELFDARSLRPLRSVSLRHVGPPVSAMSLTPDGSLLAVAGTFEHWLELFDLDATPWWTFRRWPRPLYFKGPSALSIALDPRDGAPEGALLGKCRGGWGWTERQRYHGYPSGPAPSRAVGFAAGGTVHLQGFDDGSLRAETWPGEGRLWHREP